MANEITVRVKAEDSATATFQKVGKEAQGLGKVLGDVGKIAGGFLAANVVAGAAQKVTSFIGDSISAASNLQQAIGGVESVFKENAATVTDWGRKNAANFGLSQRAFAEMAGPLGAMLKNTGMDMSEVADKTIDLTKRAADMAATFGGSATDALTAISAALRGETDPIEKYGVSMSAAKVEAEALAMTGKTLASSLTDQEKAAARLSLLFKQTADAQGQSAREADSYAGASERAKAKMEDMQATIGEKLLPVMVKLTEAKLALVEVIATKIIPFFEKHREVTIALAAVVGTVMVAAFVALTAAATSAAVAVLAATWPIIAIVAAVAAAGAALYLLVTHFDEVKAYLRDHWPEVATLISGPFAPLVILATDAFGIRSALLGALEKIVSDMASYGRKAANAFLDSISVAGISAADVVGAAGSAGGWIADRFRANGGPVMAGRSYIVGERGPELFVPGQSGGIVPNDQMGGGVTVNNYGPIYARDEAEARRAGNDMGWAINLRRRGMAF